MDKGTRGEAAVHVDAPPETVYAVVSDVTRMGEWSPETVRCEWLGGATGPAVGANSRGRTRGASRGGRRRRRWSWPTPDASSRSWWTTRPSGRSAATPTGAG